MNEDRELLTILPADEGLGGLVGTITESIEGAWPEIDAYPGIDDDQRAALVRYFEDIEEALTEVRKIVGVSSENDT